MAPRSNSKRLDNPYPEVIPPALTLVKSDTNEMGKDHVSFEDGSLKIEHPDGSVTIDLTPPGDNDGDDPDDGDFDGNLASRIGESELTTIATSLMEGVDRDILSRKEWLETRALGINLLGLKLEKPRTDAGSSTAPLEGMSTVRHPLLLEATVSFQATARAELLPAAGPVKVRNDSPTPPKEVLQETSASKQLQDSMQSLDELSQALETDLNHYLTSVATEYVPDTDRMLFYIGFGGDGFKKVYNCPLRRRPVSESVDAEDMIVSNAATDLHNSGRITHRIRMRPSVLKRMQILKVYRDVELAEPSTPSSNPVDQQKQEISGISESVKRPEDRDYEIYEIYCELDIDKFAPEEFKGKGLPLPYRVTIEKDSKQVLDVRRNWKEDDDQCLAKRFFVQFPFIRGLGFYGLGFIHLLGNTTNALTAGWRETLDGGMYANFPGFLYNKSAARQLTNLFRIPPGGGMGLDLGPNQRIQDAIMALPYKDISGQFNAFLSQIEETGRRLASTSQINVGEGKQDAPVGTTLALIEQNAKVLDSAHKRLHASQAEEFKLLKERFQEDPEALWRHNRKTTVQWKKDQFLEALDKCELVPVADPNNPTSLHRIAKGAIIKQLASASPTLYDPVAVDMRIMRISDIDPAGLFRPTPAPPPPDPRMVAIQEKAKAQQTAGQIQLLEAKIKAATAAQSSQDKAAERASREKIELMKIELEKLRIQEETIIHAQDQAKEAAAAAQDMQQKQQLHQQELQLDGVKKVQELHHNNLDKAQELQHGHIDALHGAATDHMSSQHEQEMARERHGAEMQRAQEKHQMEMRHAEEQNKAKVSAIRAQARAKPKTKKE